MLQNNEAINTELYIFADGHRENRPNDFQKVSEVRNYIKGITGFKKIEILEQSINQGLAKSIISGVTYVLQRHPTVIVLEDDMEVSSQFLKYMNSNLALYENDESVISIHGYIYPIPATLPNSFFLKGADCWGWATWRRGWKLFNENGQYLYDEIARQGRISEFNFWNSYDYYGMLKNQIDGKVNSWAIRWYASAFLNNKLTLYPGKSMVKNIGFDNSGEHCGSDDRFLVSNNGSIKFDEKVKPVEDLNSKLKIAQFFKSLEKKTFSKKELCLIKFNIILKKIFC